MKAQYRIVFLVIGTALFTFLIFVSFPTRLLPEIKTEPNETAAVLVVPSTMALSSQRQSYLNKIAELNGIKKRRMQNRIRAFPCNDMSPISYLAQRGSYFVLYNYVKPTGRFRCDESITYTTHSESTYLHNVPPLLDRWQGPMSVAVYSPGTDFEMALKTMEYLRECVSPLVKEFVSFHLFFHEKHIPKSMRKESSKPLFDDLFNAFPQTQVVTTAFPLVSNNSVDCNAESPMPLKGTPTYRKQNKLLYPINVARNIAKEMALTHYILASDVELYPSSNLIPEFLNMIKSESKVPDKSKEVNPKVYVLPPFEVPENVTVLPGSKKELQELFSKKMAVHFHEIVCSICHRVPQQEKWMQAKVTDGLHVFIKAKRVREYQSWEPVYIGTKSDPMFDERLSWEGKANKMTQNYIMCLLDYEYHVLDNAFLVHRPGINRDISISIAAPPVVQQQYNLINGTIVKDLNSLYGPRKGCKVHGTFRAYKAVKPAQKHVKRKPKTLHSNLL